jgi:hypothetical protein
VKTEKITPETAVVVEPAVEEMPAVSQEMVDQVTMEALEVFLGPT